MNRNGARVVMEALHREGVDIFFGYPGGVVLPLYDEILNWPDINHVLVRHEQCAAHMADGYARATGKVGVCLATSGPGATNLVTGLATAMMDSVPMVALTGNVNSWAIGKDAFQETDIQGITIPITKHNYLVRDVDDLPHALAEAFHLARSGRKGPILVDIPKDVFTALTSAEFPDQLERAGYSAPPAPNLDAVREAAGILNKAERPVIIAGAGVIWSETTKQLREIAERGDVPVINTLLAAGAISRHDERSLGMMGMHGEATGTMAVQHADAVISLGSRFDDRLTGDTDTFAAKATIVHFDVDPSEFDKSVATDCRVEGDLAESLPALLELVEPREHPEWRDQIRKWQKLYPIVVPNDGKFLSRHVIHALDAATKGEAIITTDVGQHQMWAAQLYRTRSPYDFISSGGLGTMGFGLPAAMGAKFARPEAETWAIVGDGGFQMTLQELQVVAEQKLDVKICLLNNGYLGMVRQWQDLFFERRYSHVEMGSPDFGKLAEAYGIAFFQCTKLEDLEETMRQAREHKGPALCEFVVEMEENVYPMVPAGKTNNNITMDPDLPEISVEEVLA